MVMGGIEFLLAIFCVFSDLSSLYWWLLELQSCLFWADIGFVGFFFFFGGLVDIVSLAADSGL